MEGFSIFNILAMVGGLSMFLFGMNIMGQALERRAGSKLRTLLGKMTTNKLAGFFTGLGVTAVIQSSSATTVMVVGFVNSGLMTLKQAINVIIGANIGTTVTGWILSMAGIDGDSNIMVQLLKPDSFTPIIALIGIIMYMGSKKTKTKDTGMILLGFAALMFGMEQMSNAVGGLSEVESFRQLFVAFQNPIFGVLAGTILTAIIQSSSASVGILQALTETKQVTYGAAYPIILGTAIGTCITAILSSIGTNKEARRAAMAHLLFNLGGAIICLIPFAIIQMIAPPAILNESASYLGVAILNTALKLPATFVFLPLSSVIEKLAIKFVPSNGDEDADVVEELDERLLETPPLALERCHVYAVEMAECAINGLRKSLECVTSEFSDEMAQSIRRDEDKTDHYEDVLGTYLVKLSTRAISEADSEEVASLMKMIGDLERISDHSVNILESAEEMRDKKMTFSEHANEEMHNLISAVANILDLTQAAFLNKDEVIASEVEPLEEVIDRLKEVMRMKHILRVQKNKCTIEAGFVWSDLLNNLERTSDHCSNIAACIIDSKEHNMNMHETLRMARKSDPSFHEKLASYAAKYSID